MVINEVKPEFIPGAKIKVLWIGWCWNKAVNRMISEWLQGVEFVAINTDAQDLAASICHQLWRPSVKVLSIIVMLCQR